MKRYLFLIALLAFTFSVYAQEDENYEYDTYESEEYSDEYAEEAPVEESLDCYQKYTKLFEERGAEDIADSTYENVVIVVDKGGSRECFSGKATVYNQKMACTTVQFATDNGYIDGPKTRSLPVFIENGMSRPYQSADGTVIVIFPKSLKPKKESRLKAPEPELD